MAQPGQKKGPEQEEVAELIDELDNKRSMTLESEIMKRATYLIEFDLWAKVMELLNIGE